MCEVELALYDESQQSTVWQSCETAAIARLPRNLAVTIVKLRAVSEGRDVYILFGENHDPRGRIDTLRNDNRRADRIARKWAISVVY